MRSGIRGALHHPSAERGAVPPTASLGQAARTSSRPNWDSRNPGATAADLCCGCCSASQNGQSRQNRRQFWSCAPWSGLASQRAWRLPPRAPSAGLRAMAKRCQRGAPESPRWPGAQPAVAGPCCLRGWSAQPAARLCRWCRSRADAVSLQAPRRPCRRVLFGPGTLFWFPREERLMCGEPTSEPEARLRRWLTPRGQHSWRPAVTDLFLAERPSWPPMDAGGGFSVRATARQASLAWPQSDRGFGWPPAHYRNEVCWARGCPQQRLITRPWRLRQANGWISRAPKPTAAFVGRQTAALVWPTSASTASLSARKALRAPTRQT